MQAEIRQYIQNEISLKTGTLNLRSRHLTEIPKELLEMGWLKELNVSDNQITDIKNLEALTKLQKLYLSGNKITQLQNLDALTNLQTLHLSRNQITDIKNLVAFPSLQTLYLSENQIHQVQNLDTLTNLQTLSLSKNQIRHIQNLDMLTNLQELDLSRNQISQLQNLETLTDLQRLYLFSNQIRQIQNLDALTNLQILDLSSNQIKEVTELEQLVISSCLRLLYLYGIESNNLNIPKEHFGYHRTNNCLKILRGYFETITNGATRINEVPVILVGNSTAGKTSLLSFIKHHIFPPTNDYSTHGVEPSLWVPDQSTVKRFSNVNRMKNICFYFWDFGGQEYYHATHRLLFSKKAIYVLLWEQKTNQQGIKVVKIRVNEGISFTKEVELPIEVFPYTYWLKAVRFFAPLTQDAPILLVQNKLDEAGNNNMEYLDNEFRKQFGISEVFHLSVKEAFDTQPDAKYAYEGFLRYLFKISEHYLSTLARQSNWVEIKKLLKQHKAEKIWSKEQFLAALRQLDPKITESGMLSYGLSLHEMGLIFYYYGDKDLKEYVFIDPDWVLKSIYKILDQQVLSNGGKFDREHVKKKMGVPFAEAFLALMKKFELIFENEGSAEYIAPHYLPETCTELIALEYLKAALPDNGNTASLIVEFPDFMPSSIIQMLITAFHTQAAGKIYWKNGGVFLLDGQHVLIESNKPERKLLFKARDHDKGVVWTVFQELRRITEQDNRIWISEKNGLDFIQIQDVVNQVALKNYDSNIKTRDGASCPVNKFSWLLENQKPKKIMKDQKAPIRVFVSYAHRDQDYVKVFVNEFSEYLKNSRKYTFNTFDDRQLLLGSDWNNKLMEEVAHCDVGILLFSVAFLNSEYIQEKELGEMLEKLKKNKNFVICPIYFRSFNFAEFSFLKQYQFFKPDGTKYGQADKGTDLCFAHLVKYHNVNGVNMAIPDESRSDYLLDLSKALFKALDEKFQ